MEKHWKWLEAQAVPLGRNALLSQTFRSPSGPTNEII